MMTYPTVPEIDFKAALNPDQYAAVTAGSGPALVLAGAGSGKTRTLTYRVAYLLSQGVRPHNILLLTFTNKAAKEMLGRVEELTGVPKQEFWGGTFHSIGQRMLRMHGECVGLKSGYTILDADDSNDLLKQVVESTDGTFIKSKDNPKVKVINSIISYTRNTCGSLNDTIADRYPFFQDLPGKVATFYENYKKRKLDQQVADYDDLLEYWLEMLRKDERVLNYYQERFQYILVDEYQDTNKIQSDIIDLLASRSQVMAVGDDAQCIYTWRGANFENIMDMPKRHPGTELHKIEINYRSTPEILNFANTILWQQAPGHGYKKELRAVRESNQKPTVIPAVDAVQQASFVIRKINELHEQGRDLSDIAVLYRAHFQAMDLQMELTRQGIPFIITSGIKFFEQAHIKDLMSQVKFAWNPKDTISFSRLLALLPKVGPKTATRLLNLAEKEALSKNTSTIQALTSDAVTGKVPKDAKDDFIDLAYTLQNLEEVIRQPKPEGIEADLFSQTEQHGELEATDPASVVEIAVEGWYEGYIKKAYTNWETRIDDLQAMVQFAGRFENIPDMLAQLVLLNSDASDKSTEAEGNMVRLTTIHQAKGLEYPVVFVIGLADGQFPLKRALDEGNVDEERRLFYVSVTRAMDELYLAYPKFGVANGMPMKNSMSRFIQEIPENLYEAMNLNRGYQFDDDGYY